MKILSDIQMEVPSETSGLDISKLFQQVTEQQKQSALKDRYYI